jgi:heme exporter protein A
VRLGRRYGGLLALDGLDLLVERGESILLLGPNGAGKSTLLRILATLLRPSEGRLALFGADPRASDRAALRRRLSLLSHQTYLYDHLTAEENLQFYGSLYGARPADGDLRSALREVDLEDRRSEQVRAFSRGMQQRLAIARAFLHKPDLLLLDEPFTGLDRQGAERLQAMLRDRIREGATCVLATHDFAAALLLATRVVVLDAGRAVVDRPAAGLDPAGLEDLYRRSTSTIPLVP